ncbi:fungal specific transcription factor domain-containing protein [Fonsecaea pedrosoi]|nr:fungal specific transcription factor domain-containing protein [Fonsecaea pedrosoi]
MLEQALAHAVPLQSERDNLMQHTQAKHDTPEAPRPPKPFSQDIAEDTQHLREGRILQDPDGTVRYLGESSGATFLNHLREYMATVFPRAFENAWSGTSNPDVTAFISALGKYQTHDSRPLLTSTVNPLISATNDEAAAMLSEFRHSAQDGEGTFASGGIYYWVDVQAVLGEYPAYVDGVRTIEAAPNALFAVACQLNPRCAPPWETGFGQAFFARAKSILGNPLDESTINDATVLALLGFYLLNSNRRDAAYIYVSIAMHILIVHGVHRAWLVDEQGKRLFWTVYILDRWLSCLMGRPALISDEAIKLDLPRSSSDLPPPDGLRAHIELARISNYIVSNIYDVARQSEEPPMTTLCIQKSLRWLRSWSENLPATVVGTEENLTWDRAVGELHMAHNQLIILTVRPLLFLNVKRVTADTLLNGRTTGHEISHRPELDLCADAARRNVHLWHRLLNLQRPPRLSASGVHFLFNAALALQLYQLLGYSRAEGDYEDIEFVISTLEVDQSSNKEYAADCARVLTDFNSLMARLQKIDLSKTACRGGNARGRVRGIPSNSSVILSPSSDTSPASYAESCRQHQSDFSEANGERTLPPYDDRTYHELLSWLERDNLQQKFDFPGRFG